MLFAALVKLGSSGSFAATATVVWFSFALQ